MGNFDGRVGKVVYVGAYVFNKNRTFAANFTQRLNK